MQNELRCCMRRTFPFIVSFFLLTVLLSCSFDGASTSGGGTADPLTSSNIVYVHGNLGFNSSESEGGALPYEILSQAQNYSYSNHAELVSASHASYSNGSFANSAYPGIDTTSTGDMYYFAEATYDGLSTPVTGSFESGSSVFTIALEVGHAWTITAGVKKKASAGAAPADTDKIVMKDSYTPDPILSTTNAVMTHTFVAKPVLVTDGTGNIELSMEADNAISSIDVICSDSRWNTAVSVDSNRDSSILYRADTQALYIVNSDPVLKLYNIPAGQYEVTFKFYNVMWPDPSTADTRVPLYTTTQTVNVVANMTTNRWQSGSASPSAGEVINATGTFNVSDTVLNCFKSSVIYVGKPALITDTAVTARDTNFGSAYSPLATFGEAVNRIVSNADATKDYKIFITGTQSGNQSLPDTLTTSKAKSITIEGLRGLSSSIPQDIFDAEGSGSVFTIETSVPITFKNIKITGGNGANGGGIKMESGTKVTLADGVLLTDNKCPLGDGGGIYCDSGSSLTLCGTAKVSKNTGSGSGGGIALSDASLIVKDSASIEENKIQGSGWGGGVCANGEGSSITISGKAKFIKNEGIEGGAIGAIGCSSITISGGTFSGNTASQGGGIRCWGTPLTMTGGTFENNSATEGGALCLRTTTNNTHSISGSVYIPYGVDGVKGAGKNDIYLGEDRFVTVAGSLSRHSSSNPIVITRSSWLRNKVIVEAGTSVSDITPYKDLFTLTNDDWKKVISSDNKKILIDSPIYVAGNNYKVCTNPGSYSSQTTGEKSAPFDTIGHACSLLSDSNWHYTILVDGELNGGQTLPASGIAAASITLKGANSFTSNDNRKDIINAGGSGTALSIQYILSGDTSVPVTIENLKITGGAQGSGGAGIQIGNYRNVTLGNDLLVQGNNGAGVYVSSSGTTLNVNGNVVVSGNTVYNDSSKPCNVYLPDGKKINVVGVLKKGDEKAQIGISTENPPTLTSEIAFTTNYGTYNSGVAPGTYFTGDKWTVAWGSGTSANEAVLAASGGNITIEPVYEDITINVDKTFVLKSATEKKFTFSATGVLNGSSTAIETGTDAGKISYSYAVSYHGETMTSPTHYTTGANYVTLDNSLPAGEYTITVTGVYHKTATEQTTYSASFEVKIVDGTVISSANIATMTFESGQKHYIKVDSSVTNENIGDLVSRLQDNEDIGESTLDLSGMNIETLTVDISLGRANITEIILPDSMTGVDASISASYFQSNSKLVSVVYSGNVSMNWGNWQFGYCTSLKNFPWQTLETGRMGNCMFWGCSSLETATIPAHVSLIGGYAFQDCSSLVEVHLLGTTPPQMETECFSGCDPNLVFYVPAGTSAAYEEAGYSSFGTIQEE